MINKYSFKYKIGNFFAKIFLNDKTEQFFFSKEQRASCLVKIVCLKDNQVLVGKKIQSDNLSKVSLPYAYVDLAAFSDNTDSCIKACFDKMNLSVDAIDFDKKSLIDVKLDYENNFAQLVYVYKYDLLDRDLDKISDSYSFYDFFLLDFDEINEYNKKSRFVSDLDYIILNKLKKD